MGACVSGETSVRMDGGSWKQAKDVRTGDKVLCASGELATIRCVVQTRVPGGVIGMVPLVPSHLSGKAERVLEISAWHPVRKAGQRRWEFPCEIGKVVATKADLIYNFVLDREKQSLVMGGDVEVAVLGHGLEDDEVIRHDYYGTARVVEDLRRAPGWADGLVVQDANPSVHAQISLIKPSKS